MAAWLNNWNEIVNNVMVNKQTSTLSPQNKQNAFLNQRNQE